MSGTIDNAIQAELASFHLPRFRDIPDVGLLLEQTMRLVNSYLDVLGDVHLTSSMISNYVKQGIIARPVKKMYGREQIADLVFIATAKTVLPLDVIKRVLVFQRENYDPMTAYDYFCNEFEATMQQICNLEQAVPRADDEVSPYEDTMRRIIVTTAHKIYLEKYICAVFPAGDEA